MNIPCEQFIFGKRIGVKRATYEVVASSGINENKIKEVYQLFNGCRPISTAVPTFKTAFAFSKTPDEHLVMVRFERSQEPELERNYFLQEHYVVLKDHPTTFPAWLCIRSIPEIRSFEVFTKLENAISVNDTILDSLITKSAEILYSPNDHRFRNSVINSLHYVLDNHPVVCEIDDEHRFDKWQWLAALGLLLPFGQLISKKLYIGETVPTNWAFDVAVANRFARNNERYSFTNPLGENDVVQIEHSYTKLLTYLLTNKNYDLIKQLKKEIDFLRSPMVQENDLDVELWRAIMNKLNTSQILELSEQDTFSLADLHWFWKYLPQQFLPQIVERFFPDLVCETVHLWDQREFENFTVLTESSLDSVKSVISVLVHGRHGSVVDLLKKWLESVDPKSHQFNILFLELLKILQKSYPQHAVELLIEWLRSSPLVQVEDVQSLLTAVPQDFAIKPDNYCFLFCYLAETIQSLADVHALYVLITNLDQRNLFLPTYLLSVITSSHAQDADSRKLTADTLNWMTEMSSDAIALKSIWNIVQHGQHKGTFTAFVELLSRHPGYIQRLQESPVLKEWTMESSDPEIMASYLYVVGRTGQREYARRALEKSLVQNTNQFHKIVHYLQTFLKVDREDVSISISDISNLTDDQKLYYLGIYMLATRKLGFKDEIHLLMELLQKCTRLGMWSQEQQEQIVQLLDTLREWAACQMVVEHQLRSYLRAANIEFAKRKLTLFEKLIRKEAKGFQQLSSLVDSAKIELSISILSKYEKNKVFDRLLDMPLDGNPENFTRDFNSLRSNFLKSFSHKLQNNSNVRLDVYSMMLEYIYHGLYRYNGYNEYPE